MRRKDNKNFNSFSLFSLGQTRSMSHAFHFKPHLVSFVWVGNDACLYHFRASYMKSNHKQRYQSTFPFTLKILSEDIAEWYPWEKCTFQLNITFAFLYPKAPLSVMGHNNSKLIKELESGPNTYLSEMIACLTTIYKKKQKHIRCVENGLYWSVPKRQISVCFPNRHTFRLKKKINTKIITTERKNACM